MGSSGMGSFGWHVAVSGIECILARGRVGRAVDAMVAMYGTIELRRACVVREGVVM